MVTADYLRRETAQYQCWQMHGGLRRGVEVVLQLSRINVGTQYQKDRVNRFIERRFALELPGLAALENDLPDKFTDPHFVDLDRRPLVT